MAEISTKTQKVNAGEIPIVKSTHYKCEESSRVVVTKMVQGEGGVEAQPVFVLSFLRAQVVPSGTANNIGISMEEAILSSFVLSKESAQKLINTLQDQLTKP